MIVNGKIQRMHISELKRQQILDAHMAKADTATIAALVGCHPTTVRGIIRRAAEPKPAPAPAKFISQAKTAEDVQADDAPVKGPVFEYVLMRAREGLATQAEVIALRERVAVLEAKLAPLLT